jgi:hypothetical protein
MALVAAGFVFSPKGIHKEVNKKSVGKPTKTLL